MNALAEIHNIRRRNAPDREDRPIGSRPVMYVNRRAVPEPPEQSMLRAELWWNEVTRLDEAGKLTNRALFQAWSHTVLAEDDPVRLRRVLIQAAAFVTEWADALDPQRAAMGATVPAQR